MWGAAGGGGLERWAGPEWGPGPPGRTPASVCGPGSTESWEAPARVCSWNQEDRPCGGGGSRGATESGRPVDLGCCTGRACDLAGQAVSLRALGPEEGDQKTRPELWAEPPPRKPQLPGACSALTLKGPWEMLAQDHRG